MNRLLPGTSNAAMSRCPTNGASRVRARLWSAVLGFVAVAVAGHEAVVFPPASDASRQGFLRIINHSDRTGEVRITAIDDDGGRRGPVTLSIDNRKTVHLNSDDIEQGNPAKGLEDGTGAGNGTWRLELASDLDIEVLAYIRTPDGFLSPMHDVVPVREDGRHTVAFFHPGGNGGPAAKLRLINPGKETANVTITAVDDQGAAATGVDVPVPAGGSRTLTAEELESGGDGLTSAPGDGTGNWRLTVASDQTVTVVNLLETPTGRLANLSTAPPGADDNGVHSVPLFPGSSDPDRQGLVRVINHSDEDGSIRIEASDVSQRAYGPITLAIGANEAKQFRTDDLERGGTETGLSHGLGAGEGDWRLALSSDLNIEVLAYVLAEEDGLATAVHHVVPGVGHRHRVALFNPDGNESQQGRLRLENRNGTAAMVSITGIDDHGTSSGGTVMLALAAGQTRMLTASALETGSVDVDGKLGDGEGKWQLIVESDAPLQVMNLMTSPTGHLANLSSVPAATAPAVESAFNDRAVGKRIVQGGGDRYLDFPSAGAYRETHGGETTTGSYVYTNTGASTATLELEPDHGDACSTDLVFESRLSGRLRGCDAGGTDHQWRLLAPSRHSGYGVIYEITAKISTLSSDPTRLDVLRGATAAVADGVAGIDFGNGGYVESGNYRYTCRDASGCTVKGQVLTRGKVVRTAALGERDFELAEANGSPAGLAYADGRFFVADVPDRKVYAYDASGQRLPTLDFDLAPDNRMPGGITVVADRFYVVDEGDFFDMESPRRVFVYDATGQYVPTAGFDLDRAIREPLGVAYDQERLLLADAWTNTVYAYRPSGERDPDADFDLDPDNRSPRGIAYGNGRFFVVDIVDDRVYAYRTNGERDPDADFGLAGGNGLARGIAYGVGRFFVADSGRVFAYPSDRPDLVVEALAVDETRPDAGETVALNVTVRNAGHRRSAPTTVRYYRSNDATIPRNDLEVGHGALDEVAAGSQSRQSLAVIAPSKAGFYYYGVCIDALPNEYEPRNCSEAREIAVRVDIDGPSVGFALDAGNRNPAGIAYGNGRFFVLDFRDDHVYAYRTSAVRDPDSDFGLDEDNDRPVAITYAPGGLYVVDTGDDMAYAYDTSGERDAAADFALDSDNRTPYAIEFANGRFHVADGSDDKVYVYDATGQREADADFDLYRGNDIPWGMTFAEDRLYVVDLIDDRVYAYATSGERDTAVEFGLDPDNGSPAGITFANGRLYVVDSADSTVYGYALPAVADLAIDTAAVGGSPDPGASFTFTATVRNVGDGPSHGAAVRYYLAAESAYDTDESLAGTGSVGPLEPDAAQEVSFAMTAPIADGCYFCGACADIVHGERVRSNNCAAPAELLLGAAPDMDVSRLQMHTGEVGDPVEVTIGVTNRGAAASRAGKLRFTGGDDVVVDIPALAPDEEHILERQPIGTGRSGAATYEMCIDVPCEGNPDDNCRTRRITL